MTVKPNDIRPPEGWTLVCQWYAYAPDDFEKRTGIVCAGDGEMFTTRKDAVRAAWGEVAMDEARQKQKAKGARGGPTT